MKNSKRTLAVFIAAATLSAAIVLTPAARAADMTTSDSGVAFIKEFEGFRSHVYWDGGTPRIGYGTGCGSTDYPNGITEAQGEALLRKVLKVKESSINSIMSKYNLTLTQNQFDALLSFTYNLGNKWMDSDYRLYSYLINGVSNYSNMEIVNAFGTWCHVGTKVLSQLVTRRLREANMFLYGEYSSTSAHVYKSLEFEAGAGSVENSIVFFELGKPYGELQTPTRSGYTFAGWYTSSGTQITPTMTVSENLEVTASWTTGTAPVQTATFSDVKSTDWYYKYVSDLSAANIITGYEDGGFHPDYTVTTGVALKLILRAVGFEEQPATGAHWASGYLTLAEAKGIVAKGGIKDLDAPISKLTIAEIAAKAIGLPQETGETFKDTTDGFVLALYYCGIVTGSQETGGLMYYPDKSINRAEISAIIWRIRNSNVIPM